jgi:hypothetical protein
MLLSALSTVTRVGAQVALQHCPILRPSMAILSHNPSFIVQQYEC